MTISIPVDYQPKSYLKPKFWVDIDDYRCIRCRCCVEQCSFDALYFDDPANQVGMIHTNCVACHRCVVFCPTNAISVGQTRNQYRENSYWLPDTIEDIIRQTETGGVLLTGMGNDKPWSVYWYKLCLNASQVTNPSIDPLR
ncbi:MAG: 4Fe-4S dicluster domain-containing protein, partial [Chloroflexi bacterium]|nr:4Fe-4S dicluster domain-containing protein [Chloroflexota bacterium]